MKLFPSRIAVFSDAHGVFPALETAWRDAQPYQPEMVLYAGDFTRGPYPNEVIEFLRSIHARMILGNDDINLLRIYNHQVPKTWLEAKQFGMAHWTLTQLSTDNI
ncbi:MAG TPA: metallophosphoesterase [Levilinea sp.]|nr:metallophosphoesterase [Levilinea sp.]